MKLPSRQIKPAISARTKANRSLVPMRTSQERRPLDLRKTCAGSARRSEDGSALLMLLAIVALLLVIVAANHSSVSSLRSAVRIVEQNQIQHWQAVSVGTNLPPQAQP